MEPLNKPESSAIRLLLPLSLLGFPEALRVSRGLVQRFPMQSFLLSFFSMGLLFGVSEPAFAWFKICNYSSEDLSVAYAYRQHYSSNLGSLMAIQHAGWVSVGWWHIPKYDCKIVYGERLTNRYSYVFSTLYTGDTPFCVTSDAFDIIQYDQYDQYDQYGNKINGPEFNGQGQSSYTCTGIGESARYESFKKVDTGTSDNFILNLTSN